MTWLVAFSRGDGEELKAYQVVDRACADGVDEVDKELDHEDSDEERRHSGGRLVASVWAESPEGEISKGMVLGCT